MNGQRPFTGLEVRSQGLRTRALFAALLVMAAGCSQGPETSYGRIRGASVNGTGVLAVLLRKSGHEVRTAVRLTDELSGWADVIVRFASIPGPPHEDEGRWYVRWLAENPGRRLVYVVRDYDAEPEYWERLAATLTAPDQADDRLRAEARKAKAADWENRLPLRATKAANPLSWFRTGIPSGPTTCKSLGGAWATDIEASRAGLSLHEPLVLAPGRRGLLTGEGKVLAMDWDDGSGSRVLAIASGTFLLNLPLSLPARRPLAGRVVDWIDERGPGRLAFVEGPIVVGEAESQPNLLVLIARIASFRWVALHLALVGLLACLARIPRLGRARTKLDPDAHRPAAHAEAVGALLARTREKELAHEVLRQYRTLRHGHGPDPQGRMA